MCRSVIGIVLFFFSSRRRHTRYWRDWSSVVCSSDLLLRYDGASWSRPVSGLVGTALRKLQAFNGQLYAASTRTGAGKIGRASCRERVQISVVGVSLKKKITARQTLTAEPAFSHRHTT